MNPDWKRPQTAAEVCHGVKTPEDFGRNVRDWQHELRKVHDRPSFVQSVAEAPLLLRETLGDNGACDAYLAAYVEWLSDRLGVTPPDWVFEPERSASAAWYDYPPLWVQSFVRAPGAFRRRAVFTTPEDPIRLKTGRPKVAEAQKRIKNAQRQKRYRAEVREKLLRLKALEAK